MAKVYQDWTGGAQASTRLYFEGKLSVADRKELGWPGENLFGTALYAAADAVVRMMKHEDVPDEFKISDSDLRRCHSNVLYTLTAHNCIVRLGVLDFVVCDVAAPQSDEEKAAFDALWAERKRARGYHDFNPIFEYAKTPAKEIAAEPVKEITAESTEVIIVEPTEVIIVEPADDKEVTIVSPPSSPVAGQIIVSSGEDVQSPSLV